MEANFKSEVKNVISAAYSQGRWGSAKLDFNFSRPLTEAETIAWVNAVSAASADLVKKYGHLTRKQLDKECIPVIGTDIKIGINPDDSPSVLTFKTLNVLNRELTPTGRRGLPTLKTDLSKTKFYYGDDTGHYGNEYYEISWNESLQKYFFTAKIPEKQEAVEDSRRGIRWPRTEMKNSFTKLINEAVKKYKALGWKISRVVNDDTNFYNRKHSINFTRIENC